MNGGGIKSVQGDSGHAQAKMVTDQYSHILDDNRRINAQLLEQNFYMDRKVRDSELQQTAPQMQGIALPEGIDQETLVKILTNPETDSLLVNLAKGMGKQ